MLFEEGRQVVIKPDSSIIDLWNSLFSSCIIQDLPFIFAYWCDFQEKKHKQHMNPVPHRPLYQDHSHFCSFPRKNRSRPPQSFWCLQYARFSCTAAFDCRQLMKPPHFQNFSRCAYAWDKIDTLSYESNISRFTPSSMSETIKNCLNFGKKAISFNMNKFAVQWKSDNDHVGYQNIT